MSEKDSESKPMHSTAMRAFSPVEADGHTIGIALADEATLAEAGKQGITAEDLERIWQRSYALGRNAIEGALGSETPYAASQLRDEEQS